MAIRDPRCNRPHLIVLVALIEAINQTTGTAFPSRQTIGRQEELSAKTVENVLYELRSSGSYRLGDTEPLLIYIGGNSCTTSCP